MTIWRWVRSRTPKLPRNSRNIIELRGRLP